MCTRSCSSLAALAVALVAVTGCPRQQENAEAYAARNAVVRYNQALVEAFRASRAELLTEVATGDEISRVVSIIAGLATRGQFMVSRQTNFEVIRTTVATDDGGAPTATVEAKETWTYEHRSLEAKNTPVPPKTVSYRLTYLLEPHGGGWLVGKVKEQGPLGGEGP